MAGHAYTKYIVCFFWKAYVIKFHKTHVQKYNISGVDSRNNCIFFQLYIRAIDNSPQPLQSDERKLCAITVQRNLYFPNITNDFTTMTLSRSESTARDIVVLAASDADTPVSR